MQPALTNSCFPERTLNSSATRTLYLFLLQVPTPIQRKAIPQVLAGRDVVAMGRTVRASAGAVAVDLPTMPRKRNSSHPVCCSSLSTGVGQDRRLPHPHVREAQGTLAEIRGTPTRIHTRYARTHNLLFLLIFTPSLSPRPRRCVA